MDTWELRLVLPDRGGEPRAEAALRSIGVELCWTPEDRAVAPAGERTAVVDLAGRIDPPAVAVVLGRAGIRTGEMHPVGTERRSTRRRIA